MQTDQTTNQLPEEQKIDVDEILKSLEEQTSDQPKTITLDEHIDNLYYKNPNFQLNSKFQYYSNGKIFQMVAKIPADKNSRNRRDIPISVCVNHAPNSKYTGEMLREIRKQHGVGRPLTK